MVLGEGILDAGGRQARYSPSCRGLVSVVSDEVLNSAEADDSVVDMLGEEICIPVIQYCVIGNKSLSGPPETFSQRQSCVGIVTVLRENSHDV